MKIPATFNLLGNVIAVTIIDAKDWKEKDCVGFYNSFVSEIAILKRSSTLMEHTFLHEMMHAVLTAMGQDKLSKNEAFVDMSSGLIHQALSTAKGHATCP
jgi:hypothetical protein